MNPTIKNLMKRAKELYPQSRQMRKTWVRQTSYLSTTIAMPFRLVGSDQRATDMQDTSFEQVIGLLKGSSSKAPIGMDTLLAKYDGAINLQIVLDNLYEKRQVQRAKVIRSGREWMEYWLTGVIDRNVPYGRTGSTLPPTPVPARQLAKDNVNGINLVSASTVSKVETVDAPVRHIKKVERILAYLAQVGDWVRAQDIAKMFDCACGAEFLKKHIKLGNVLLDDRGHGKKSIKLKPGVTAAMCIEAARASQALGRKAGSETRKQAAAVSQIKALDNVNGINLVSASTVSKVETVDAPVRHIKKVERILAYLAQVGDWVRAQDIAKMFDCACGAEFLKKHIKLGNVLLDDRGHGKKSIKLKPGVTAAMCIEAARASQALGRKAGSETRKQAAAVSQIKAFAEAYNAATLGGGRAPKEMYTAPISFKAEIVTEEPQKLDEWDEKDKALRQADQQEATTENEHDAITQTLHTDQGSSPLQIIKPAFRIAYTNDGCLILKNVFDGYMQVDVELDVEQTRDLVNFISALDLEAQP